MLRIFSGKSSHPLADAKSARELFERLNGSDPFDAIDEIDSWLESTSHDAEIKPQRRVELLFQLDAIGTAAAGKLAREYLTLAANGDGRKHKLWRASHKFWLQLAASYRALLDQFEADKKLHEEMRAALPALQMRLLRAYGGCLKWSQFRYDLPDPDLWLGAGKLYLQAEKNRWLDKKLTLDDGASTTIAAEYLSLLLFHAASMDRLQPLEIELAEQLLAHLLPAFSLTAQARPENVYWIDAAKPLPPTRLAKLPEIAPTLRFFATANALSALEALRDEIVTTQAVPKTLALKQPFAVPTLMAVLQHLAAFCAAQPPTRSHARLPVKSSMQVADGLQSAVAALRGRDTGDSIWAVEDVSRSGMQAQLPLANHAGLGIGSLLAMCPEGGDNWLIGIVRRFSRRSQAQGSVGIETVGRAPSVIAFDSSGLKGEGLLLDAALNPGSATLLAVPPDIWRDFKPVSFEHGGYCYSLRPLEEHQRGNDYVIGRYWVSTALA